jgi:hypothetical protein
MGPAPTGKHLLLARARPGAAMSTVRIPIAHEGLPPPPGVAVLRVRVRVPCAVCRVPCAVCRVPCAVCRVPCRVIKWPGVQVVWRRCWASTAASSRRTTRG